MNAKLLEVYWRNVDPTQKDGQFCDHGPHYRTAILPEGARRPSLRGRLRDDYGSVIERPAACEIACEAGAAALSYAPMRWAEPLGRFPRAERRNCRG